MSAIVGSGAPRGKGVWGALQCGTLFVNLGLEFVTADLCETTCLFILVIYQLEDVDLVPLVGSVLGKLFFFYGRTYQTFCSRGRN